jgi:hypothetical protein
VLPTLAFVAIWVSVGALAAGCGHLVRRLLTAAFGGGGAGVLAFCDVWIGLASLTGYLLFWNMFLPVTRWTWAAPFVVGLAGLAVGARRLAGPRLDRRAGAVLGALGLGWLVLADQALAPSTDYDFGLYHLDLITYAEKYAAIPGLANLHSRLGAGDAHLLLTAFLDQKPLAGAGPHLANGLLASLLLLDVGQRVLRRGEGPSFTRRLAVLLVPALLALIAVGPSGRLASPNLDLATFVVVAVGLLYLAECVERALAADSALAATAALALASATRPLYWPMTAFAAGLFIVGVARRSTLGAGARAAGLVVTLPVVLALGWMWRQYVLSGYPLFPLTIGGGAVDWRVPHSVIVAQNRGDDAWARWPGPGPTVVLASWHWLRAWWLPRRARDVDVLAPLMLLACLAPVLGAVGSRDPSRGERTRPMLAVVAPSLATLVIWFFVAPDPRFAFAPIWLVPAALVAWALPPLSRPSSRTVGLVAGGAVLAAIGLVVLGENDTVWMLPAALAGCVLVAGVLVLARSGSSAAIAVGAVTSVILAGLAVAGHQGNLHAIVRADGSGPLRLPVPAPPTLMQVVTNSGLQLTQPVNTDQCFQAILCVPLLIGPSLHMRGPRVSQGFSVSLSR